VKKKCFLLFSGLAILFLIGQTPISSVSPQEITFSPSIRVDDDTTDQPQASPCMAAHGDSIVYIAWRDYRDVSSTGCLNIYFSSSFDGGKTWTKNLNVTDNSTPGPYLSRMEADNVGNIYLVWGDEAVGNLYFSFSSDSGKNWAPPVMINDISGFAYNPSLAIDEEGIIYVTWSDERDDFWSDIYFAKSTDQGSTWTNPAARVNDYTSGFQGFSNVLVHKVTPSYKNIYVSWTDYRSGHSETFFSKSEDGGKTWEENVRASDIDWAEYSNMAVDNSGTIHLVYSGKPPEGNRSIFYTQSTNQGSTWLIPNTMVSPDTFSRSSRPNIALDTYKNLYVMWKATPELPGNELDYHIYFAMSQDSGQTWSDPIIRVDDSTIDFAEGPCINLGDGGEIYAAWNARKPPDEMKNIYFAWAQGPNWVRENECEPPIPKFSLKQNYPNPFNSTTLIRYTIPDRDREGRLHRTSLKIYNILGEEVITLVDGKQEARSHQVIWGGRDRNGKEVVSGVYLCRLSVGGYVQTKKLVLLR